MNTFKIGQEVTVTLSNIIVTGIISDFLEDDRLLITLNDSSQIVVKSIMVKKSK